jgi:hypothetical protein
MPLSLNERNPDLIARVDDAYERALTAQCELASGVGGVALDALIQDDIATAREQISLAGSGLEAITSPLTRMLFSESLKQSEELFAQLNLSTPTTEQLAMSGIDFAGIGAVYEQMLSKGLEPLIVLAPSIRPDEWQEIYRHLEADTKINATGRRRFGGLHINSSIASSWNELSKMSDAVPATVVPDETGYRTKWTLRIIPGTDRPTETGITHNDPRFPDKPTVHEYLALQANLLQRGQDPIDGSTHTWLSGTFENESHAPRGTGLSSEGQIELNQGEVDYQYINSGVRLPLWSEQDA